MSSNGCLEPVSGRLERRTKVEARTSSDSVRDITEATVARLAVDVPAVAAQDVADRMVGSGIRSILNFAPTVLSVPAGVDVRKVDLSIELQILAFHAQRRAGMRVAGNAIRGPG